MIDKNMFAKKSLFISFVKKTSSENIETKN